MPNHWKTTSLFVEEAQKVHGGKYDYSEMEYFIKIRYLQT